jgi:hypothetical protein
METCRESYIVENGTSLESKPRRIRTSFFVFAAAIVNMKLSAYADPRWRMRICSFLARDVKALDNSFEFCRCLFLKHGLGYMVKSGHFVAGWGVSPIVFHCFCNFRLFCCVAAVTT